MKSNKGMSSVDVHSSQSIVNVIGFDVIVNNLKTTKAASVDKRVVFLQLICALVQDGVVVFLLL